MANEENRIMELIQSNMDCDKVIFQDSSKKLVLLKETKKENIELLLNCLKDNGYHIVTIEPPYQNYLERVEKTDGMTLVYYQMRETTIKSLCVPKTILYLPHLEKDKSVYRFHLLQDSIYRTALAEADNESFFTPKRLSGLRFTIGTYDTKLGEEKDLEEILLRS